MAGIALTREAFEKVKRDHEKLANMVRQLELLTRTDKRAYEEIETLIAKSPSGGVPARTGNQPGTASCDVYTIGIDANGDPELEQYDPAYAVTGHNLASTAVAGSAWITLKYHMQSERWLVDWEDC